MSNKTIALSFTEEQFKVQEELEMEMRGLGQERYFAKVQKAESSDRMGDTAGGMVIIRSLLCPLKDAVEAFLDEVWSPDYAVKRANSAKCLALTTPEVAAYMTLRGSAPGNSSTSS